MSKKTELKDPGEIIQNFNIPERHSITSSLHINFLNFIGANSILQVQAKNSSQDRSPTCNLG